MGEFSVFLPLRPRLARLEERVEASLCFKAPSGAVTTNSLNRGLAAIAAEPRRDFAWGAE
jgi:hypothetical protein